MLKILIWCNSFKKRFLCIFRSTWCVHMGHIQSFAYQVCFHLTSGRFAMTFCVWCEMSKFDICLSWSKKGVWSYFKVSNMSVWFIYSHWRTKNVFIIHLKVSEHILILSRFVQYVENTNLMEFLQKRILCIFWID